MGKAANKQADAGTEGKDGSLALWEGKLKQELKWHFFGYYHVTKERTNDTFHNGPE